MSNPCPACGKGMTFTIIPGRKKQETCPEVAGGCGYAEVDGVILVEPSEAAVVGGKVKLETLENLGILRDRDDLQGKIDKAEIKRAAAAARSAAPPAPPA